ncbi:MAG TPA: 30S ribosomal protein S16 [Candidatus Saccharimonadales bacterium]|nr:30S ribosomal protein S16 [Candidatus Saccharimonadales bacterium]
MLAIRLQRLGRKAAPVYRLAVQEAQRHPSSGRVVAYVGAYNPHTKEVKLDAEKIGFYLKNGAQPTPRVVKLLTDQKIAMPAWVKQPRTDKESGIRNPDKLRKNQPKEEAAPEEPATEEASAEEAPAEQPEETKE